MRYYLWFSFIINPLSINENTKNTHYRRNCLRLPDFPPNLGFGYDQILRRHKKEMPPSKSSMTELGSGMLMRVMFSPPAPTMVWISVM